MRFNNRAAVGVAAFILMCLCSSISMAGQVKLAWDPNPQPLDGYLLFMRAEGKSFDYRSLVWSGIETTCTIDPLASGTYYFVVRAYAGSNESGNSNQIKVVIEDSGDSSKDGLSKLYEDAEDGKIAGWFIYDRSPSGASIANVYDANRRSSVIELDGSGTANGFRLRNEDGSKWNNSTHFVIEWSMKYSDQFVIYLDVETTAGHRYLVYRPLDKDALGSGEYINFGIGSDAVDGRWRTFTRDLQADLENAQPGVRLLKVIGFLVRGSGRVDDIKLHESAQINLGAQIDVGMLYEDAEDGQVDGWYVYDSSPSGSSIANVYDAIRKSSVIELDGSGTSNGFRLRNEDGSKWNNSAHFIIQWSMKYSEQFYIFVDLETTAGHRYLMYRPLDKDGLGSGEYIGYGIGGDAVDGRWQTFSRDLQADLEKAQPGVRLLNVNGFLIRGSGRVDDIMLKAAN